jgi:Na+/proline symporter/signal transduction histidine kinase
MSFNIDSVIFLGFLLVNIVLGLGSSRGIKDIKEFAIGKRDFSTATIVATIVATWISGSYFFTNASEVYKNGLIRVFCSSGNIIVLFIVGKYFSERMGEFLGKISIAEAMGDLYGKKVRIITAIFGSIGVSGFIAVQLKVAGMTFEYALGIPAIYGILSAGVIITLYSSLGGIRSVTFTDVIQFFTFTVIIPIVAYVLIRSSERPDDIYKVISEMPIFDYKSSFNFTNPKQFYFLSLFLYYLIPAFNPAIFQRIAMASSVRQVKKSFTISSIICALLLIIITWISIIMLSINPELDPKDIVKHIIFDHAPIGVRGIILVGIMAMVMSTVDSYVNAAAVIITHDLFKPLGFQIKNELVVARITSFMIGGFAIFISVSLIDLNILGLLLFSNSLYMPIVTVPFIMALLGFRSTEKPVLLGMLAGFSTVIIWNHILKITSFDSIFISILANVIVLMSSHYLLKSSGGWVGIKDTRTLKMFENERKQYYKDLARDIKNFSLIETCKRNSPSGDGLISILGFFVMVVTFSCVNYLPHSIYGQYDFIFDRIYPISLVSSSALIGYPLWLQSWKDSKFIAVIWNIIMFFVLICFSFLIVLISNFAEIQLIVFMINILIIISLIRWKWALFNISLGMIFTTYIFNNFLLHQTFEYASTNSQFKTVYLMLLTASSLVLFLKPKQYYNEVTEEKNLYLSTKVQDQKTEMTKLHMIKNEFLRNLEHEAHTPITGITSMGQVLWEAYDKLSDKQRKDATKEIAKSSERLTSLVNNLIDISKLESMNYHLNEQLVDLTELIHERVKICKKLYIDEKNQNHISFELDIEENVMFTCDEYYISRTIDNIIINAIQYSNNGLITIKLEDQTKANGNIFISIQDEGIGIPVQELSDIFNPFTVSSRTKSHAGGRGIGLTLCKKVVEAHRGKIQASSNGVAGSTFTIHLPSNC